MADGDDTPAEGEAGQELAGRLCRVEGLLREALHEVDDLRRAGSHPAGERAMERAQTDPSWLTEREWQILALVAEGQSNKEIGARLSLSPRTVHGHLQAIGKKVGIHGRTALAAWWHAHRR